jgi:hypothetical protein
VEEPPDERVAGLDELQAVELPDELELVDWSDELQVVAEPGESMAALRDELVDWSDESVAALPDALGLGPLRGGHARRFQPVADSWLPAEGASELGRARAELPLQGSHCAR